MMGNEKAQKKGRCGGEKDNTKKDKEIQKESLCKHEASLKTKEWLPESFDGG